MLAARRTVALRPVAQRIPAILAHSARASLSTQANIPPQQGDTSSQGFPFRSAALSVATGLSGLGIASLYTSTVALAKETDDLKNVDDIEDVKDERLMRPDIVLYQYEVCPFCSKVRAYMDYNKIPYRVVEVNPISKAEVKFTDYRKVPILVLNGVMFKNSSDIIAELDKQVLQPRHKALKETVPGPYDDEEVDKWCKWVDNRLVHTLPPNIYRSMTEALEAFAYIGEHGNFTSFQRIWVQYAGATAMWAVAKKLKKKHGFTDDVRTHLIEAVNEWLAAVGDKPFHGGDSPNAADLSVYGTLSSIEGLAAWGDLTSSTTVENWYRRTANAIGDTQRYEGFEELEMPPLNSEPVKPSFFAPRKA